MGKLESFVLLPDRVILSDRLKKVSPHARWMLVVMLTRWRRGKQEAEPIEYTYTELRKITGYQYNTIAKCFRELVSARIITKIPGGLERNKNAFVINHGWLEQRPYTQGSKTPPSKNWTNGKSESLAKSKRAVKKLPGPAVSVSLDMDKLFE